MPKIKLRSKNPSASELRTRLSSVRTKGAYVVRLGSRTPLTDYTNRVYHSAMEINTIDSIENSRNKLRMKNCFAGDERVQQSDWYLFSGNNISDANGDPLLPEDLPFPIVVKQICGFKGHGMVKCENPAELVAWMTSHNSNGYYMEQFKNFAKEYRLHATQERVFLSWRKLRKADAQERWFFNSTNCNWVNEDHELFSKPEIWEMMCEHACKAIKATGLSIGAVDVRVKSGARRLEDFIILEVNSAPELGEVGTNYYYDEITKMVKEYDNK